MASGGGSSSRRTMSEPRSRPSSNRHDSEDVSSLGSARFDDRPNNWDFSDWQPSSVFESKRMKKGNPEREKEKEREKEREREREHATTISQESSPRPESSRHHTPSTFPRTKITTTTPLAQRVALENLRQHMTFSDAEEPSTDGERNNERFLPQNRDRASNFRLHDPAVGSSDWISSSLGDVGSTQRNTKLNKEAGPDSNQIVGRLMQIRDYIKQATAMMGNLQKSTDPGDQVRATQLEQVISRLKEQEQKYLDLLLNLSRSAQQHDKLGELVCHLEDQQTGYVGLLRAWLATREEDPFVRQNSNESGNNSRPESDSEIDVQSDTTEATTECGGESGQRPRIEDRLGRHSDTEAETMTPQSSARSSRSQSDPDNATTGALTQLHASTVGLATEASQLLTKRTHLESDLGKKNDELDALRQQHDLLKKMLYQQEQLRALQGRQAALQALQRDAELRMSEDRALNNEGAAAPTSMAVESVSTVAAVGAADVDDSASNPELVPQELHDLRRRLNYLKNIYDIGEQGGGEEQASGSTEQMSEMSEAASAASVERRHLQDKLKELQGKKRQMDELLVELESLRNTRLAAISTAAPRNNGVPGLSPSPSQVQLMESVLATAKADRTAGQAQDVLQMMESRKKHQKLQEVRERLNQLRDLVQYYQSGTAFIHGTEVGADSSSLPDLEDPQFLTSLRNPASKDAAMARLQQYGAGDMLSGELGQQPVESSTTQADSSDTESQHSSSAGAWAEDQHIQQKVRKLQAAKEKLRRLQDLVAMVQASPDMAQALPDDLAQLASSLDEVDSLIPPSQDDVYKPTSAHRSQDNASNTSANNYNSQTSESDVPCDQREQYYEARMRQQQQELGQLMEERRKLLAIQDQLQRLHDQLPPPQDEAEDEDKDKEDDEGQDEEADEESDEPNNARGRSLPEAVQVTFQEPLETVASYDELYGRMRQQRMLREELREKKKELEDMMRKDRPRKHYSRNQDNQSDNVSYSNKSDPFGASLVSGDVTMATWGGSTADNLESIEEDENDSGAGQDTQDNELDDGYPSDGIVQVEEEEEANVESDDHDTYTIEDELRHSRTNSRPLHPPVVSQGPSLSRRRRGRGNGAPLLGHQHRGHQREGQYQYNYWSQEEPMLNNARPSLRRGHRRDRHMGTSAVRSSGSVGGELQDQMAVLRQELDLARSQLHALQSSSGYVNGVLSGSPGLGAGSGAGVVSQQQHLSAQLHHHQLLLHITQLLHQEAENADRLRRVENFILHLQDPKTGASLQSRGSFHGASGILGMSPAAHSVSSNQYPSGREYSPYHPGQTFSLNPQPFHFEPESHSFLNNPGAYAAANGYQPPLHSTGSKSRGDEDDDENTPSPDFSGLGDELAASSAHTRRVPSSTYQSSSQKNKYLTTSDRSHVYRLNQDQGDSVPIQTIQATDQRVPRLQLDHAIKSTSRRSKTKQESKSDSQAPTDSEQAVIGRKFPTPQRAKAASRLASLQGAAAPSTTGSGQAGYRPGLSAGISGTTFHDNASMSSIVSSLPGGEPGSFRPSPTRRIQQSPQVTTANQANSEQDSDAPSGLSLFEALRETIYSEVATLISQNESRPHFLIELFRDLQLLNSDYLRQRALYAIQELVTKHLSESDISPSKAKKGTVHVPHWRSAGRKNNISELTPSESLVTSDDDEVKARLYSHNPALFGAAAVGMESTSVQSGSVRSGNFDYAEQVETGSSMSTPTDSSFSPFAKDSLGDTVINLDKAMQQMREYERRLAELETGNKDFLGASPPVKSLQGALVNSKGQHETNEIASSSAQDSESSMSEMPETDGDSSSSVSDMSASRQPRIDTGMLDQQIRAIITEVIPILKEHMEDVCSTQLLQYVRHLVLSLTRQSDESHEFVRFFHKQLGSIVQDSLAKYEGKKMRECGEDMLGDLSEILFNELAFFRLMQDLDDPKAKVKAKLRQWTQESQTSTEVTTQDEDVAEGEEHEQEVEDDESEEEDQKRVGTFKQEKEDTDEAQEVEYSDSFVSGSDSENQSKTTEEQPCRSVGQDDPEEDTEQEEEDLGKARDDEMAARMEFSEKDDDSESRTKSPVKIELAVSETKPFTRIGSDEDDEGDEEAISAEDPSETAVSRDARNEQSQEQMAAAEDSQSSESSKDFQSGLIEKAEGAAEPQIGMVKPIIPNGDVVTHMNGEVTDNGEEITVEDLPPKLYVNQASLDTQLAHETHCNSGASGVLAAVSLGSAPDAELAGDSMALKEPDGAEVEEVVNSVIFLTSHSEVGAQAAVDNCNESEV